MGAWSGTCSSQCLDAFFASLHFLPYTSLALPCAAADAVSRTSLFLSILQPCTSHLSHAATPTSTHPQIRLLEEDAAARQELIIATREKSDDEKAATQRQIAALEFQVFTLDARCTEVSLSYCLIKTTALQPIMNHSDFPLQNTKQKVGSNCPQYFCTLSPSRTLSDVAHPFHDFLPILAACHPKHHICGVALSQLSVSIIAPTTANQSVIIYFYCISTTHVDALSQHFSFITPIVTPIVTASAASAALS
jgi:hypothetical protein